MARKPTKRTEFVLFDVFYEDGTRRSNRRVPAEELTGLEGEKAALRIIMDQDREIAERSGQSPMPIKNIRRVGAKEPTKEWKRR